MENEYKRIWEYLGRAWSGLQIHGRFGFLIRIPKNLKEECWRLFKWVKWWKPSEEKESDSMDILDDPEGISDIVEESQNVSIFRDT